MENFNALESLKTDFGMKDWDKEAKEGYKQSNLEDQCTHRYVIHIDIYTYIYYILLQSYYMYTKENICIYDRYKIYIEGWAWSVSEKYIMACDSMTLYMKPRFYDFFIRGMVPLQHFWPINDQSKCSSLKFAVQWGNNNTIQVLLQFSPLLFL